MVDSVEKLSEFAINLSDKSKSKRQRAVATILSKIDILSRSKADFTKDIVQCIAEGVHKGLLIAIETKDADFCSSLLKVVKFIANIKHSKSIAVMEKISQSLLVLETEEVKSFPSLEEVIVNTKNSIFQIRRTSTAEEVLVSSTVSQYADHANVNHMTQSADDSSRAVMITKGAGAILNLHVVFTGWKFPKFVVSETDEAYLFELLVHLNMKHTCGMAKLWDTLTDFPPHVLMTRTGLLHLLLDVIGSTFTQMDIDADPEGLNPLTAMRWLTKLLQLAQHAYKTQLSGSLCSVMPKTSLFSKNGVDITGDDSNVTDAADESRISSDLAFNMFAIKHPLLPSSSSSCEDLSAESQLNAELGAATVSPIPSVAGLAFAVCAAVLPRLQSRDPAMGQQVLLTLRTALPMVVEACDVSGPAEKGLSDVPRERLQHLLSKIEQMISFYEEESVFDLNAFVSLISSDEAGEESQDPSASASSSLKEGIFGLTFLSVVIEVFRVIPAHFIAPLAEHSTLSHHLKVGPLTVELMSKMIIGKSSTALLSQYGDVFVAALLSHDSSVVQNIQRAELLVRTAKSFSVRNLELISAATDLVDVVSYLLSQADTVAVLLDRRPLLAADAGVFKALSAELDNVVAVLPVLLLAAHQHDEGQSETDIELALRLMVRIIGCSSDAHRLNLLSQLLCWVAHSGRGAEDCSFVAAVIDRLEVDSSHRKQLIASISTPVFVRCLMFSCILRSEQNCTDATAAPLKTLALHLLDKIAEHMLSQDSDLTSWVDLLCPLKVVDWHSETGSFLPSGGDSQASIASVLATSSDIKSTVLFTRRLHDYCASSKVAAVRLQHHKSLVLGAFYHHPAIRSSCGMKLHREVLGVPEASLPSAAFDRLKATVSGNSGLSGIFGANYDPLKSSHLETEGLGKTQDLTLLKINAGSISCRELDVLVSIAFNREIEFSKRTMAVVQMFQFLSTDSNLLQTRLSWLVSVAQSLVTALTEVSGHIQEAKEVSVARTNLTTAKAAAALSSVESVSSEECSYFKSLSDLLCLLVVNVRDVRERVSFDDERGFSAHSICMVTPLRCFLGVSLLGNSLAGSIAKEIQDAEKYVGSLCGQALSVICLSTEGWKYCEQKEGSDQTTLFEHTYTAPAIPTIGGGAMKLPFVKSSKMKAKMAEINSAYEITSVHVPALLAHSFLCVKPATVPYVWRSAQLEVKWAEGNDLPPFNMLAAVIEEHLMTDIESIRVFTVAKLFNLLADAKSHADLGAALTLTKCLGTSFAPLFRLFVDFKLSLVTALSSIIVNLPRTSKDHVTLSQTIQFLTVAFQQLQQFPLFSAGVEAYNEAVAALIPTMGEFFRENVSSQYRKKFRTTAEELEYAKVNQSIQLHYLELLFVLSGFSQAHLMLSELLMGSYIWSYCVQNVLCSETAASHVKAVVAGFVENCVVHHNGLYLMLSLKAKTSPSAEHSDHSPVLDSIIRSVKLLRAPNSMQCNHALVSNLRIFYLSLLQLTSSRESAPALTALLSRPVMEWRFLVRLIYDRRAEVKLLALQILTILLENVKAEDKSAASMSILNDSLDGNDPDTEAKEVDTSAEEQEEHHQWPPYDMLYNVIADTYECRAVRLSAIRAVVKCVRSVDFKSGRVNYYVLLTALSDILSLSGSQTCAMSLEEGMELLSSLLVHTSLHLKDAADIIALIRSLKLLPAVVDLLRHDLLQVLVSRATDRVSKEVLYTISDDDAIQFDSEYVIREPTTLMDNISDLLNNKWFAAGVMYQDRTKDSVRLVQTNACRVVLLIREVGLKLGGDSALLFEDCIRFSAVVEHVLDNLSNLKDTLDPSMSEQQLEFEMLWQHANVEVLISMINYKESAKVQSVLEKFLLSHADVVPEMSKQTILYFRHILSHPTLLSSSSHSSVMVKCLDGLVYLMAVMLNDSLWRAHLDLGGPFEGCEMGQLSEYLFSLVLALRDEVSSLKSEDVQPALDLLTKIDLVISLFLQHSYSARSLVVFEDEDESDCLVRKCLAVVTAAAEFISNPRNAVSPAPAAPVPSSGASVVSHASISMASTVNNQKPTLKKGSSGLRTSTSTLGSKALSANNSKWREKTRSYAWNDDKSKDGTVSSVVSKVNMATIEFTPAFKLQLYNALMILTYALPENPLAMIVATKYGLHQSLNKLLRYAARHSLSISITSATSSVLSQLDKSAGTVGRRAAAAWKPTSGQIASALYALTCSYTLDSSTTKTFLMNAGENPATILNGNAGSGHILHHFVSVGTNKGVLSPVRWLCLSLTNSLVSSVKQQQSGGMSGGLSSSLVSTLATTTAVAIQRIAQNPFSDSHEALYYLINCLTAFIASNSERLSSSTLSSQNVFYNTTLPTTGAVDGKSGVASDLKLEPFESLIVWVYDNFNHLPEVQLALCRCLGVITSAAAGSPVTSAVGSFSAASSERKRSTGTNLSSLMGEALISILCGAITEHPSPSVVEAAHVSLWSIMHQSEKAKMTAKEVLGNYLVDGGAATLTENAMAKIEQLMELLK